jgi:hypothetical protein
MRQLAQGSTVDAVELLERIADADGLYLRSEAVKVGLDDRLLGLLRRAGRIHRIRHGVYVDAWLWRSLDARGRHRLRVRAELRVNRAESVVSHISAALEHVPDWWGLDLNRPHLTRTAAKTAGRAAGVVQHRGRLRDGDVVEVGGVAVTSPARTILEVTTVASIEASLVTANAILHAGLCSADDVRTRYEEGMDRWPHTLGTNVVLHLMDHRIESVGESRTCYLMWRFGLPRPELQYEVREASGELVGRLDFAFPEYGIWIEFDGKTKYEKFLRDGESSADAVFREKKREDRVRRVTGWRCIRLTWADLENPQRTAAMLLRELGVVR